MDETKKDRYEEGFRDGFLKACDYVVQNANVHKNQFESIWKMFKDTKNHK